MILFVGNSDLESFEQAKNLNNNLITIFPKDISDLNLIPVGYASLSDHTLENFLSILAHATSIHYIHSSTWDSIETKIKTESWIRYFSHHKPVYNLESTVSLPALTLADTRKTDLPQVWAAGCSFTAGVGVADKERWATIAADHLGYPISLLAHDGASIAWAADQLLRSDIRENDIILWGLTGIGRVSYYNGKTYEFTVNHPSSDGVITNRYLSSDHLFYQSIGKIEQVITRAKDLKATLIILMFPFYTEHQETILIEYLSQFNFFVPGYTFGQGVSFIDLGTDRSHPGPQQHRHWANIVLNRLDHLLKL